MPVALPHPGAQAGLPWRHLGSAAITPHSELAWPSRQQPLHHVRCGLPVYSGAGERAALRAISRLRRAFVASGIA